MMNIRPPARPDFRYRGKTKNVARFSRGGRRFMLLRFNDNILGRAGRADSGGNEIVGTLPGKGLCSAAMCEYFMKAFEGAGVPTHFVSRLGRDVVVMETSRVSVEFVCRNLAWGGYLARGGKNRARPLERFRRPLIEYTLKSDALDDPPLDENQISAFVGRRDLVRVRSMILAINAAASALCRRGGLRLADFKAEFGFLPGDGTSSAGHIVLIDDFSCDTARFFDGNRLLGHFDVCRALGID